jgi:FSR family fosmidomycin resistance protein-like MFS transporter
LAVERQLEDGKAYFARLGRTVPPDNIFIDNGVSASAFSTRERHEYRRALAKIEAGDIDHIWMWAEDRTYRQVIELAEFIHLCREHSVRVPTAGTEYDLSDPDQVSMWFIKVRFAEAEVEKISRRMKRQTLQAAEKGLPHPTGRRVFGEPGRRRVKDGRPRCLAEEFGLRLLGMLGVIFAALFLSLIGVAPALAVVVALLVIGGMGSAALHPVGTTIAGGPAVPNPALGVGAFTAGGMLGFALGPILILWLVARFGVEQTPWLMLPGLLLGVLVYLLLPDWAPHRRRSVWALVDPALPRGPVGKLALAGSLESVAFLTFTSSVPVWLVRDHGLGIDDPLIGWTLAVFSFGAGLGSLLGGVLAPRLGRRLVLAGSLLATAPPLLWLLHLDPGSLPFFLAAALGGTLIYTSSPVMVVAAQDLAPRAPAAASGMVLGVTTGIAGALYVALGRLQETIGLAAGMTVGFTMVVPAALLALAILIRHPAAAGRRRGPRSRQQGATTHVSNRHQEQAHIL